MCGHLPRVTVGTMFGELTGRPHRWQREAHCLIDRRGGPGCSGIPMRGYPLSSGGPTGVGGYGPGPRAAAAPVPSRSARVNPLPPLRSSAYPPARTSRNHRRAYGPLALAPITAVIGPPEERRTPTSQPGGHRAHHQPAPSRRNTRHHNRNGRTRTVRIPGSTEHAGHHLITVTLGNQA